MQLNHIWKVKVRQRPCPDAMGAPAGKRGHGATGFFGSSVQCPVIGFMSTERQLYQGEVVAS